MVRAEPPSSAGSIELDDWRKATDILPALGRAGLRELESEVATFFNTKVEQRERFYSAGISSEIRGRDTNLPG